MAQTAPVRVLSGWKISGETFSQRFGDLCSWIVAAVLPLLLQTSFVIATIFGLVQSLSGGSMSVLWFGVLASLLVALYFYSRVVVIYPAATGARLRIWGAWEMARHNVRSIFWAFIITFVAFAVVLFVLLLVLIFVLGFSIAGIGAMSPGTASGLDLQSGMYLASALFALLSLAAITVGVGVASSAYRGSIAGARPPASGVSTSAG